MMAFGDDASQEDAVATLESPIFENVPSQCFHFFFSINVSFPLRDICFQYHSHFFQGHEWHQIDNNFQAVG